jgi:glutamyl-tRNA synthetase
VGSPPPPPRPPHQLERKGYYIVDRPFDPTQPQQPLILFNIPDGRAKAQPGMPAP